MILEPKYFVLHGHEVVEASLREWRAMVEDGLTLVSQDYVGPNKISTVFLGLDHDTTGLGPPQLFETMVFPQGSYDELFMRRYATWDEAAAGHLDVVAALMVGDDSLLR